MRYYETLCLINPDLGDEDYKEVITKFSNLVEKNNGTVIKVDEWGKKPLAYTVRRHDKGYYILMEYCGETGINAELERDLRLDDRILKYQTVKLSDKADPEALKAKAEALRSKEEEGVPSEEASPEKEDQTEEEEDKNGA